MILGEKVRVFIYREFVDMRKGHDGLFSIIMNTLNLNPQSGDIYVFMNKSRKIMKPFLWDGTGMVILHKKLDQGRFMDIQKLISGDVKEVTLIEFQILFEGIKNNFQLKENVRPTGLGHWM